ncbi:MAG: exodeoxyribonuclease V subunit gamma [Lentisphaeria bacterium]|nr:exodeoxyribonuclease V subunit gamma [Lentisphaeria bacterium]
MAIAIYNSNRMEDLAKLLGDKMRQEAAGNPFFHQQQVIVPNKGIARFLTLQFTENNKIVMGMEFPYLMTFLLRNVGQVTGDVQEQGDDAHDFSCWDALINTESLTFRINALLPELLDSPEFASLKHYTDSGNTALRRWQLAGKIAALYDRYMLWRPDWILQWEAADLPLTELQGKKSAAEKWQRTLWRAIRNGWPAASPGQIVHFAHIHQKICSGEWQFRQKEPVRLFGFSTIPSPVLECLERLKSPVEIYSLSPCEEYWGDAKTKPQELRELIDLWEMVRKQGMKEEQEELFYRSQEQLFFQHNPLLGSFAVQGRKFFSRSLDWENHSVFPEKKEPETLLEKIRCALRLNQKSPETPPQSPAEVDFSVQIHNCYSEYREVETLHDYLLNCFARDDTLTLNDVIIMSPVPERYASFIEAVFHNPANGENMLRTACSERSSKDKSGALENFLKLLRLAPGTFEVSAVMDILAVPEVQKSFDIFAEDLSSLRQSVHASGIRWGWDAAEHEAHGGKPFRETSWRMGLDRLLLGYAGMTSGSFDAPDGRLYGMENTAVEGEALGKFCRFADAVHETVTWMRARANDPAPIGEWSRFLLECAALFFGEESALYALLRPALANLRRNAANGNCSEELFQTDVVLAWLDNILAELPEMSRDFLRGKITFCGLRPMRTIPGKIICLLGMNHDTFPRESTADTFDLMHELFRSSDPDPVEDERQLFIEILLSARRELYISYCGHGIRDNKKYPASSCVEELRLYMTEAFGKNCWYETEEPLQAFDPALFQEGNPARSHSKILCRSAALLREKWNSPPAEEKGAFYPLTAIPGDIPEELYCVSVADLERFFSNPALYFMKKRLNAVPYEEDDVQLQDTEPFFVVGDRLSDLATVFNRIMETPEEALPGLHRELRERMQSNGTLPLYKQLEKEWPLWDNASALCGNVRRFLGGELRNEESCTVSIGKFALRLPRRSFYNEVLIFPLFYNLAGSAYRFVLEHVAANLTDSVASMIIGKQEACRLPPLEKEEAVEKMHAILKLYEAGMSAPLLFFPKTSFAAYSAKPENVGKTVRDAWAGQYGEKDKFEKYYGDAVPDADLLRNIAERFFLDFEKVE